jgi:hypothetical protein
MGGVALARDDSRMLSGLHQRLDVEVFDIIGKGKAALGWKPSGAPSRPSPACMAGASWRQLSRLKRRSDRPELAKASERPARTRLRS